MGFNYTKFLEDADPAIYAIPKLTATNTLQENCPTFKNTTEIEMDTEENIIKLLTKAKRQAVTKNISVIDFLQGYDRHREGEILEVDFKRGIDNANIKLSKPEVEQLCKMYVYNGICIYSIYF